MGALLFFLLRLLVSPFRSIGRLEAENSALRRQLIVLQRQVRGVTLPPTFIQRSLESEG